jgi:PAS domain S-box-containing protein/putative nucleotidyltransferase with HDIG domain
MEDNDKTNEPQITESEQLRQRIAEPERSNSELKLVEEALWKSGQELRNIMKNINDVVFQVSPGGIVEYVNPRVQELYGYKPEELIGKHLKKTTPKSEVPKVLKLLKSALSGKTIKNIEIDKLDNNGKIFHMEINSTPVKKDGKIIAVLGVMRDITERKRAEEMLQKAHQELERRVEERTAELSKINVQLRQEITERKRTEKTLLESEEKYRSLVERANDGITIIQDRTMKYVNPSLAAMWGGTAQELMGTTFTDYIDPDELPPVLDRYNRRMQGEDVPPIYETVLRRKDGSKAYVELNAGTITYQGKLADLVFVRDITDRKRTEEELRESEERYRSLVDNIDLGINLIDPEHNIIMVNCTQSRHLNKPLNQTIGKKCYREFEKRDAVCPHCPGVQTMATGQPAEAEIEVTGDDQRRYTLRIQTFPVLGQNGTMTAFIEVVEDITERKRMEQELRESEERFRKVVETMKVGLGAIDENGVLTYVNEYLAKMLGYSADEMIGSSTLDFYYDEESRKTQEEIFAKRRAGMRDPTPYEVTWRKKDGQKVYSILSPTPHFDAEGRYTGSFAIHTDITERKRANEKLKASFNTLRKSLESTVSALASALEIRDPYTAGHQQRVADLACAIAEEMGLADEQLDGIRMAGLIHDIGKINIPAEILNKPGQLTEIEYSLFKNHPQVGHDILKTVDFPWPVAQIVLQHHERMDGSGYPQGLKGDEIMLEARILAVADIVEAMASHRPYRPARGTGDALEEILHNKGILYDPEVVDACLRVFYDKGFSFEELAKAAAPSPKIH